jgi:hypothetical protein
VTTQHPRRSHAAAAERDFCTQQVLADLRGHVIPVGDATELQIDALAPEVRDSFFGDFCAETVPAELAS